MKKYIFGILVILLLSGCSFLSQSLNFYEPSYSQNAIEERLRSVSRKWQKMPYVLGGTSRRGADCSDFTQTLMREFGIMLPRTIKTQMASGIKVSRAKLRAGDLVFFRTDRGPNGLHVGIYLSRNEFVHLSAKGGGKIVNLNSAYWKSRYLDVRHYTK